MKLEEAAAKTSCFASGIVITIFATPLVARWPSERRARAARALSIAALVASAALGLGGLTKWWAGHDDPSSFAARVENVGCFTDWSTGRNERTMRCAPPLGDAMACTSVAELRAALVPTESPNACAVDVSDAVSGERARLQVPLPNEPSVDCYSLCTSQVSEARAWLFTLSRAKGPYATVMFAGPSHAPHGATFDSFARDLAPPTAWSLAALLGVAIALLALIPLDRPLRERLAWREETYDGVTWLVSPHAPSDAYRAALVDDPSLAVRGTHADLRATLDGRRAAQWAFAATSALLLGAPPYVAAALGFVF